MEKIDIKDVFSWSNAEEAKTYIGKEGYFIDCFSKNLDDWDKGKLSAVNQERSPSCVFESKETFYGLFVPKDKLKEVEKPKKYRPFTLDEFNKVVPMGTVFKYRYKANNVKDVYSVYYHTNLDCENGFQAIYLENRYYSFEFCFNELKLFLNGEWQPFGVSDESA